MRFRSVLSTLVILGAAAMSAAATSSAQGPAAPPAFDGKYVGTARQTGGSETTNACYPITSVEMTVTGPQVVMNEIHLNGAYTYHGSVNAVGEVSAVHQSNALPTNVGSSPFTIVGTIHDKVFTGERKHGGGHWSCFFRLELAKQ